MWNGQLPKAITAGLSIDTGNAEQPSVYPLRPQVLLEALGVTEDDLREPYFLVAIETYYDITEMKRHANPLDYLRDSLACSRTISRRNGCLAVREALNNTSRIWPFLAQQAFDEQVSYDDLLRSHNRSSRFTEYTLHREHYVIPRKSHTNLKLMKLVALPLSSPEEKYFRYLMRETLQAPGLMDTVLSFEDNAWMHNLLRSIQLRMHRPVPAAEAILCKKKYKRSAISILRQQFRELSNSYSIAGILEFSIDILHENE